MGLPSVLQAYHAHMAPARRRQFLAVLALMLLASLVELATIGSVVPLLTILAGQEGVRPLPGLMGLAPLAGLAGRLDLAAAAFISMLLLAATLRLALTWSTQQFTLRFGHDLAVAIHERILSQPYSFHTQQNSSEVLAVADKVQVLVSDVFLQLMYSATAAITALFIVAALVSVDPATALGLAAMFSLFYLLVTTLAASRMARNSAQSAQAYGRRTKIVQESVGAIRDVIIDGTQAAFVDAFARANWRLARARASTGFVAAAPRYVIEAVGMTLIALLALWLSSREGSFGAAVPILGAVAVGSMRLLPYLQQVHHGWTILSGNRAVAGDVLRWLDLPVEAGPGPAPAAVPALRRSIVLEGVSFRYAGRRRPAVERLSLDIPFGSKLALVGRTGSGKSTTADILMGLLEPSSGRILIDGTELAGPARIAWRHNIAHVPQAIFLADSTIAENIAFGVPAAAADPDRLRRAVEQAQLDEVIAALPDGLDTLIGERGIRLSGGQRQRVGIARALYKDAAILVLDEATSALDEATEAAVMQALTAPSDRTVILIAHRSSTLRWCDRLIELDQGRLVAVSPGPRLAPADER